MTSLVVASFCRRQKLVIGLDSPRGDNQSSMDATNPITSTLNDALKVGSVFESKQSTVDCENTCETSDNHDRDGEFETNPRKIHCAHGDGKSFQEAPNHSKS